MNAYITQTPPEAIALVTSERTYTQRELLKEARQLATCIANTNTTGHIGILAQASADYIIAIHAAQLLGRTIVPFNTRLTEHELKMQLEKAEVTLLLVDEPSVFDVPELLISRRSNILLASAYTWGAHEVLTLMFTSGTTGVAKAVQQTYANHFTSAQAAQRHLGHCASDRFLIVTPLFHMSGLAQVYRAALYGVTIYLEQRFDPDRVVKLIRERGITHISLVALMLERLIQAGLSRSNLKCILVGGGPVPLPLLEEATRLGLPIAQTYGMTETCSQVATLLPDEALTHIGSSGKAISPTSIRISVDGEIEVKGPSVTPGYFRESEANAYTTDGFWKTGDLGELRGGYLYVFDRRSDLILSGGENIYPAEVESAIRRCPGVEDVGVAPYPDDTWGQIPVAYIVGTFDEAELFETLRQHLAKYKHPRTIVRCDTLPRNANGKLMRHRLKELNR